MGASATISGQNLGAGKPERSMRGVAVASSFGLGVAAIIGLTFLLAPHTLLAIFGMTEPQVTGIGTQLLRYLSVSGFFITVALSYTGGLQGTGDTKSPLYISIVSQIVVPIGFCEYWLHAGQLKPGHIWMAIVLGHFTRMALSVGRFRQGKWRNIAISIPSAHIAPTGLANREEVETQATD
jgi:Na+-driven multidrug efflux pump